MTSLISSVSTSFKHWLAASTNPFEIDEIGMTNGTWKEFSKQLKSDEADDVVDALVLCPFAAFFYRHWDDTTNSVPNLVPISLRATFFSIGATLLVVTDAALGCRRRLHWFPRELGRHRFCCYRWSFFELGHRWCCLLGCHYLRD